MFLGHLNSSGTLGGVFGCIASQHQPWIKFFDPHVPLDAWSFAPFGLARFGDEIPRIQ